MPDRPSRAAHRTRGRSRVRSRLRRGRGRCCRTWSRSWSEIGRFGRHAFPAIVPAVLIDDGCGRQFHVAGIVEAGHVDGDEFACVIEPGPSERLDAAKAAKHVMDAAFAEL